MCGGGREGAVANGGRLRSLGARAEPTAVLVTPSRLSRQTWFTSTSWLSLYSPLLCEL